MAAHLSTTCGDNLFGPRVLKNTCRSGFDFTLLFEELIFAIVPSALLLLAVPWRLFQLHNAKVKVIRTAFHIVKLVRLFAIPNSNAKMSRCRVV